MTSQVAAPAGIEPQNGRFRRSWYWYDWANSAYVTTTATVLLGPLPDVGRQGGRLPRAGGGAQCATDLSVLGVPVDPGSLVPYTVTAATILSAIVLIFVGAIADRSPAQRGCWVASRGRARWPPASCSSSWAATGSSGWGS